MATTQPAIRGPRTAKVVSEPAAPARTVSLPSANTYQQYKAEVRTLVVVVAVLLVAAGLSLSVDRSAEPVFYGQPDLSSRSTPDLSQYVGAPLVQPTPGATAAPAPPAVTVVTVPVPANNQPIIIREPAPTKATATAPAVTKYDNGGTPPVVRITRLGPQNQDAGKAVELEFQAGDSDGVISGWIIDWGDGATSADTYDDRCGPPPGEPDHLFPSQRHVYRDIGTYPVKVLVVSRGTCKSGPTQRATAESRIEIGPAVINMVMP